MDVVVGGCLFKKKEKKMVISYVRRIVYIVHCCKIWRRAFLLLFIWSCLNEGGSCCCCAATRQQPNVEEGREKRSVYMRAVHYYFRLEHNFCTRGKRGECSMNWLLCFFSAVTRGKRDRDYIALPANSSNLFSLRSGLPHYLKRRKELYHHFASGFC